MKEKRQIELLFIIALLLSCVLVVYNLKGMPTVTLPTVTYTVPQQSSGVSSQGGSKETVGTPQRFNVNTASKETLMTIPGIGEKTASYIVAYIEEKGPVSSIEQLEEIYGIGEKTVAVLKEYLYAQ